jgi:hypothetical protein
MRFLLVVIGVAVMVIGAVLLVIPTIPQPAVTIAAPANSAGAQAFSTSAYSLAYQQPITGSWSANTTVLFEVIICSAGCSTPNATIAASVVQTGTSGSFAVDVPEGGIVQFSMIGASGTAAHGTVNFSTALTLPGSIALIAGIALIVLGFFLRAKRKPAAVARPPPKPRPATPPTITVAPTSPGAPPQR